MKICIRCHEDCSNRPRVKDPDGRYICRACLERAVEEKRQRQAEAAAPAPAPAPEPIGLDLGQDDDDVLIDLTEELDSASLRSSASLVAPALSGGAGATGRGRGGGGSKSRLKPCPACSVEIPAQALVCMHCGGRTNWDAAGRKAYRASQRKDGEAAVMWPVVTFCLLSVLWIGLTMLVWNNDVAGAGAVLLMSLYVLSIHVTVAVFAFMDEVIHGVLCLCCSIYQLFWVPIRSGNPWVIALFGASIIAWCCSLALQRHFEAAWSAP